MIMEDFYSCRNPLKSGQCFLQPITEKKEAEQAGRNPLKSGQCFLLIKVFKQ